MKTTKFDLAGGRFRVGTGAALAAVCALWAGSARADVEVARRWAQVAPTINGVVSPGEWNSATATTIAEGGTTYAQMRTMNDGTYLYVLLDVYADTVNSAGDYFRLLFDKDLNYAVTPGVDFFYSSCNSGAPFIKAILFSQTSNTGCETVDPGSEGVEGFGTSFNSATPHRIWEFRLLLSELGVNTSGWSTSSGSVPKVRMDVIINSVSPAFTIGQPAPLLYPDMHLMYQVDLATFPMFPPGSTGPTFAGVGLVPANYIDGSGYANINISGYYYATDAPFGSSLNVFGNWNTLQFAYGATRYRVLYSKNGGAYSHLKQTWTNFEWNGTTWVPTAIGPDSADSYPIPPPWQLWYLPNLLISWQTAGFGDGTYNLKLELLNSGGFVLSSPPANSLTLFVDNTAPTVSINNTYYDDAAICECGIVTQGPCVTISGGIIPILTFHGFTFNITVNDLNGALNSYSLDYTYGNNEGGNIFGDSYVPSNVNASGPESWTGVSGIVVPALPFCAPAACAYTFVLSASSRVQNGYGAVFPYVSYNSSLTILTNSSGGGIVCP